MINWGLLFNSGTDNCIDIKECMRRFSQHVASSKFWSVDRGVGHLAETAKQCHLAA